MRYARQDRIAEEMKKALSQGIRDLLTDAEKATIWSITQIDVTKDLRHAKIYVSILGSKEEEDGMMMALEKRAGSLRKLVGRKVRMHFTPELHFFHDHSIEHGMKISKILNEIKDDENHE
jgi:ribosome-binding factor A